MAAQGMPSCDDLKVLLKEKQVDKLKALGSGAGLVKALGSDTDAGLTTAEATSQSRVERYGNNYIEQKDPKGFWELVWEACKDPTVIILAIAAFVSVTLGIVGCVLDAKKCPAQVIALSDADQCEAPGHEGLCLEWLDGLAVTVAVLAVSGIAAFNDWRKEKQFRKLNDAKNDILVKVLRDGTSTRVSTLQIVVGDIVLIDTGDKIPADGVFLDGHDIRADESSLTGESDAIKKDAERPFMLSGCTITDGVGRFVVTSVGENTEWGQIMKELSDEREDTPLQDKLGILANGIGYLGIVVATFCFVAQLIRWFVEMGFESCFEGSNPLCAADTQAKCSACSTTLGKSTAWESSYDNFQAAARLPQLVTFFIESVTIVVVAVPEGLPLAVTISLAYSVRKMMKDNNLVRVLAACETMGGATNICSDKTGTLTENRMKVVQGYFQGKFYSEIPAASALSATYVKKLCEAVSVNSKGFLGKEESNGVIEFIGNKTECALLVLARTLGVDYDAVRKQRELRKMYAFSSAKKRMSSVVDDLDNAGKWVLYTKGASEIVLELCTKMYGPDGSIIALDENARKQMNEDIVSMASSGLRTICITERTGLTEADCGDDAPETDLTCIALVGIEDPPRKEVPGAIETCRRAGIRVRMVTGDNILTARSIAVKCGILPEDGSGDAMEGPQWRQLSEDEQRAKLQTLAVLARAHPTDKLILVKRLKELGEVVAVTGDGTNDAPALKEADVGLSMGIAGTEVAKEASDVVILDDNFASIIKSVMWGRSVYDNIRRFLQFQLTVNVVALVVTFVGALSGYGTPLKPIQLLWVNLIMDSMGALALATEQPKPDLLERKPYGRNDSLISPHMFRNIAVQSIYQTISQLVCLYAGVGIFYRCVSADNKYLHDGSNCVSLESPAEAGKFANEEAQTYVYTIIFNAFVFSQIFNEINSRLIYNEINMFDGFWTNPIFVFVVVITAVVQVILVEVGDQVFATLPLDAWDWVVSILIGLVSLPLGVLQRYLPPMPMDAWWSVFWNGLRGLLGKSSSGTSNKVQPEVVVDETKTQQE